MADIILYQDSNFHGRAVNVATCGSYSLETEYNFNDRTSSIRVKSGIWLLYTDSGYASTCWIVGPGEYASPGTWGGSNDSISSLRPLPGNAGDHLAILFGDTKYGGRMVSFTQASANFSDFNFNDKASSALILGGQWSVYYDADFHGESKVLTSQGGPEKNGRYPSYSGFFANDKISSIKPL